MNRLSLSLSVCLSGRPAPGSHATDAAFWILSFLAFNMALPAFGQSMAHNAEEGEVVIKGKIGNVHPPQQIWIYMGEEKWESLNADHGRFEYRKRTMLPARGAVMIREEPYVEGEGSFFSDMELQTTIFEAGEMYIEGATDSIKKAKYSGPAATMHNQYRDYWNEEGNIVHKLRRAVAELNAASAEAPPSDDFMKNHERRMAEIYQELDSLIETQVKAHPDSLASTMAFFSYINERRGNVDEEKAKSILALFSKVLLSSGFQETAEQEIARAAAAEEQNILPLIQVGDAAPAFSQASLSGEPVSLSDFKGRYTLLDFWASWCGPCRKANPDLVKLYRKYQGERFEILGISLDDDRKRWEEAIEADGLEWRHASDLKGWDNDVVRRYGVNALPGSFLVDPEGKVIAVNLESDDLAKELERLLK